ncbi:DJ-1/PfpI family protein [Kitasatospora sp. NPDC056651]|uniref:DJ-1/PfpI family protein n=1 Tax=Kitasatospora sp. NPDC056651 TaxID=3345892 RepID=UPI0036C67ACB
MRVAVLLYDEYTALDAVGPYEVLSRIPGAEVVFTAARRGPMRTDMKSLALTADATLEEVDSADVLLVPGGPGTPAQLTDQAVLEWVRAIDATTTWTTSVCSGSLLLGAAGLLEGRRATSHWICLDQLATFGARPTGTERVVVDGKYATAAGVSAGIDLALTMTGLIAGDTVAQAIQLTIEYDPQPPYASGALSKASPEVAAKARQLLLG